jgi:hypothetical protein
VKTGNRRQLGSCGAATALRFRLLDGAVEAVRPRRRAVRLFHPAVAAAAQSSRAAAGAQLLEVAVGAQLLEAAAGAQLLEVAVGAQLLEAAVGVVLPRRGAVERLRLGVAAAAKW